jgi:hypothetical protein
MVRFPLDGSTQAWIWQEVGFVDSFVFVVFVKLCQIDYIRIRWGRSSAPLFFWKFCLALLGR